MRWLWTRDKNKHSCWHLLPRPAHCPHLSAFVAATRPILLQRQYPRVSAISIGGDGLGWLHAVGQVHWMTTDQQTVYVHKSNRGHPIWTQHSQPRNIDSVPVVPALAAVPTLTAVHSQRLVPQPPAVHTVATPTTVLQTVQTGHAVVGHQHVGDQVVGKTPDVNGYAFRSDVRHDAPVLAAAPVYAAPLVAPAPLPVPVVAAPAPVYAPAPVAVPVAAPAVFAPAPVYAPAPGE